MNIDQLLAPEMVICPMLAGNATDVLKQICDHLLTKGYVTEEYEELLLKREAEYPTGLNTVPFGVAIPHTDDTFVRKPCIHVTKLEHPVEFREIGGTGNLVKVIYIFTLVLNKHENQLSILQAIMTLFSDEGVMRELEQASSPDEIIFLLRNKANQINDMTKL